MYSKNTINNCKIENATITQINGNVLNTPETIRLLTGLTESKVAEATSLFYSASWSELEQIVNLFEEDCESINIKSQEKIVFYKFLLLIIKKEDEKIIKHYISNDINKERHYKLWEKCNNIAKFYNDENFRLNDEWFENAKEKNYIEKVICFYIGNYTSIVNSPVSKDCIGDLYYVATAYFYLNDFINAKEYYQLLITLNKKKEYEFLLLIVEITLFLIEFDNNKKEEIESKYKMLLKYECDSDIIRKYEWLYYSRVLQSLIFIDIDSFEEKYDSLENKDNYFQFLAAYYLQKKKYSEVTKIYEQCIFTCENAEIYEQLVACYLEMEDYSKIIELYDEIPKEYYTKYILYGYLTALRIEECKCFEKTVKHLVESIDDIEKISYIVATVTEKNCEAKKIIDKYLVINKSKIFNASNNVKITFLSYLYHVGDINQTSEFIREINVETPDERNQLLNLVSSLTGNEEKSFTLCEQLYEKDIKFPIVLEILSNKCIETGEETRALSVMKELFEIKANVQTAMNIILLSISKNIIDSSEYIDYISYLKKYENQPEVCLRLAKVYNVIDDMKKADYYLYKSIFQWENTPPSSFLGEFIKYNLELVIKNSDSKKQNDIVIDDTVVSLKNHNNNEVILFGINSESEFQTDRYSIGVKQLSKKNPIYFKLKNQKINDIVNIDNKEFEIVNIINKYTYAFQFAINQADIANISGVKLFKLGENPEEILKSLIEELKKCDNSPIINQINQYYSITESGIPLDLIKGNYDQYLDIVKYFLLGDDQLLFAGVNNSVPKNKETFVLSLSAIVVLKLLDALEVLTLIEQHLIIPKSLIDFVYIRCANSANKKQNQYLSLSEDDKLVLYDGENYNHFWNDIYSIIYCLRIEEVTQEERNITFLTQDGNFSHVLDRIGVDNCQLDSLILAKKNDYIYVSDDLFFRKIATAFQIKNFNSSCFLHFISNYNQIKDIFSKFFNSNYLYPVYRGEYYLDIDIHSIMKKMDLLELKIK